MLFHTTMKIRIRMYRNFFVCLLLASLIVLWSHNLTTIFFWPQTRLKFLQPYQRRRTLKWQLMSITNLQIDSMLRIHSRHKHGSIGKNKKKTRQFLSQKFNLILITQIKKSFLLHPSFCHQILSKQNTRLQLRSIRHQIFLKLEFLHY